MAVLLKLLHRCSNLQNFATVSRTGVAGFKTTSCNSIISRLPLTKSVFFDHYREKYDPDFKEEDFLEGVEAQASYISHRLAEKDLDSLADIVWPEELDRLRNRVNYVKESDFEWLRFEPEHVNVKYVQTYLHWYSKGPTLGIRIPVVLHGNNSGEGRDAPMNFYVVYVMCKKLQPNFDIEDVWMVSDLHHKHPQQWMFII